MTLDKCTFLSLNVRGLRSFDKRKAIFTWLKNKKADIIFLQETYSTSEIENIWKTQWKGKVFYSHGTIHSRGTMILIGDNLEFELMYIDTDSDGRYIFLEAVVQGSPLLLVDIYVPNTASQQDQFFSLISRKMEEYTFQPERYVIMGGDFNFYFNIDLDCSGGNPQSKTNSIEKVKDVMAKHDLIDIWRIRHPDMRRFTWRQKNPFIQRRLDFWLVSNSLQDDVDVVSIIPSLKSDHSAILLKIVSVVKQKQGPSFWRFNSSLIEDSNYCNLVSTLYPKWLEEFNFIEDKRVLWDLVKYKIRQETIQYTKLKANVRRQKISELENKLSECEQKCNDLPTEANLRNFEISKLEYESYYDYIIQGAIIRSRAKWYEEGEKNTSYFLRLETHNHNKSCIRKIHLKDSNSTTCDPNIILKEVEDFYSSLYSEKELESGETTPNDFCNNPDTPLLTEEQKIGCEGKLTKSECHKALLTMKNGKTPGNDGLNAEFYKYFWPVFGELVVNSLNEAYEKGELSTSQKQAIIKLIEKKDRDKTFLENWRPISLINVDVKIATKALAKRLEPVLPHIIHRDQNAYVKGRLIHDGVRLIDDLMSYTEEHNLPGLMLAVDFEKAFDTLRWSFLRKSLKAFNFGDSFIKWVDTMYKNIQSCVLNNGFATRFFEIQRGVRQGDPLSPYLFIIALELLAIRIRGDLYVRGFIINYRHIKLNLFADDLTSFLADKESYDKLMEILLCFGKCSGLKINKSKLEALHLGGKSSIKMDIDLKRVDQPIKILGIYFTYDRNKALELNLKSIIKSLKNTLNLWKWRNLTIIGKIQIVKTFALSKFLYRASLVPNSKEIINEANSIIFEFIWKGKDKVKRKALIRDYQDGGLKMLDLECLINAQKMSLLKRYYLFEEEEEDKPAWISIMNSFLKPVGGSYLLRCNFELESLPLKLPPFYRECLTLWSALSLPHKQVETIQDLLDQIVWNNKFIKVNKMSCFFPNYIMIGIHRISDMLSPNGGFLQWKELKAKGLRDDNYLAWYGLVKAIPRQWREGIVQQGNVARMAGHDLRRLEVIINSVKIEIAKVTSKDFYKELASKLVAVPTAQERYNEIYKNCSFDWEKIYALPFQVALDTRTREFQFKILNRILYTNIQLKRFGYCESSSCTFGCEKDETLEHLLCSCRYTQFFWLEVIKWLKENNIVIDLSEPRNILFGVYDIDNDFHLVNHLILIGKQSIVYCKTKNLRPDINIFIAMVKNTRKIERQIAQAKNKLAVHLKKWEKIN